MSVRQHLLATLVLSLAITLGMIFTLHLQQRHEANVLRDSFLVERGSQLADAVIEQSESIGIFVQDYSGWDEMVSFAASLSPEWARLNIVEVMERYRLNAVWLVATDGRVLYGVSRDAEGLNPPPKSALARLAASKNWTEEVGGFYLSGDRVVDLRARPVQPTADTSRKTPPVAWLLAARALDDSFVERMERRLQARVSLHRAPAPDQVVEADEIVVHHDLAGLFGGDPVASWHAIFKTRSLAMGERYNAREMVVWIFSVALLLGVVGWSVTRYVLRPLSCIAASLEADSPAPLAGFSRRPREFERIAELIRQSYRQREALRREIDDRTRLGRDLHDGVIQNLYATGMGIAHGVRLVSSDPDKARARLEETLRTLNETMEALRGFIARAEPETASEVDFADACVSLFQTLRIGRECQLDLDLDPKADRAIPAGHKANLLLIVREAVSNALRHGNARNISVSLRRDHARWTLRVCDDGRGHDFSNSRKGGRGLENIRARAADLGGAPAFVGAPESGVEVVVAWPVVPA